MAKAKPSCSDEHCQKYSILNNHPEHHIALSHVLNTTQFCEAFFHVPEVRLKKGGEWHTKTKMQCLDEENCRVLDKYDKLVDEQDEKKNDNKNQRQPKHVVSFVVLKRGECVKYKAMYENCVLSKGTKHAEEFFDEDPRGKLKEILDELDDILSRMGDIDLDHPLKLYMYITLQPCHYSTKKHQGKSCTDKLIEVYEGNIKQLGIEIVVKPTFIFRVNVYWSSKEECISKAKEGLKKLCETEGIKVEAMKEEDWSFLKKHLCPAVDLFCGGSYEGSERKKLDDFIRDVIKEIVSQESLGAPQSSGSGLSPDGSAPESSASRQRNEEGYDALARKLKMGNDQKLKWNGTKEELKTFLSLFSKKKKLRKKINEDENNDPRVGTRFKTNEGSIFIWYKNKTLLCQGEKHKENKDKLSKIASD